MSEAPKILSRRRLAGSRLFHIEELALRFGNGQERRYERILGGSAPASVLVVPMRDDDTVLLVREYAAGMERYELGLPKGRIEPGETPLQAANREIMEEVGQGARSLREITALSLAPAYIQHLTHVILAQDLYHRTLPGDEPEPPEVVPWRLSELPQLFARADCSEARTQAALYLARDLLQS
jgi:ADP-ribose diphosphatase